MSVFGLAFTVDFPVILEGSFAVKPTRHVSLAKDYKCEDDSSNNDSDDGDNDDEKLLNLLRFSELKRDFFDDDDDISDADQNNNDDVDGDGRRIPVDVVADDILPGLCVLF